MPEEFDISKEDYEKQLMRGVSLSGQSREHFIRWRIRITKHLLKEQPNRILDFGCGEGASYPFFKEAFPKARVMGYEPSEQMASTAKTSYGGQGGLFTSKLEEIGPAQYDLVYTNGVFHHIKPEDRTEILKRLRKTLTSKGILAFWENNPWHLGTRLVMSRIPFDKEAKTLSTKNAARLIKKSGFQIRCLVSSFHLPWLEKLPWAIYQRIIYNTFGAQYLFLAAKSE